MTRKQERGQAPPLYVSRAFSIRSESSYAVTVSTLGSSVASALGVDVG